MVETKTQHFINLIDEVVKEPNHERRNGLINNLKLELKNSENDFNINDKHYHGTMMFDTCYRTVLSYAAEKNLVEIVQQVFDRYAGKISKETLTHAIQNACASDSNYDSVKVILQHLKKNKDSIKDCLQAILDISFAKENRKIYALILEHVVEQGYSDIIDDQFTQYFDAISTRKELVKLILQHGNDLLSEEKVNQEFLNATKNNELEKLKLLTEQVEKKISFEHIEKLFENGIRNQNNEFLELVAKFKDKISPGTINRIFPQIDYNKDPNRNDDIYEKVKLVLQYGPTSKINQQSIQTVFISAATTNNNEVLNLFLQYKINIPEQLIRCTIQLSDVALDMKFFLQNNFLLGGNNSHGKPSTQQLPAAGNKIHNSPQKQQPSGTSPGGWTIGLALLFGAVGATLVATGIIPEIAAIGVIATAVLLGIASAALGGAVGYLTDITVNKCCSEAAVRAA